jgi:alpha-mannosidase/mannosylglycerate hydrolase
MINTKPVMHVLSHTHWDREWYQEFQGYRQRLVFQIDSLLDLLEKRPEYRAFHLDGQTACLLDYLEIRPENRERITRHMLDGRILIGPWFVMPDEFLLSGESLVRNLMMGHNVCKDFDVDPMPVGYVTDIFGHCSQLPQILRGFGIETALLHRGTSSAEDETSEMVWEAADGSEALLIKVYPFTGYGDFMAFREAKEEDVLDYEQKILGLATTPVLFSLDGNDHQPAYWKTPEYIDRMNGVFKQIRCVHSSMTDYLSELRAALGPDWQAGRKRHVGELRLPNKRAMWGELSTERQVPACRSNRRTIVSSTCSPGARNRFTRGQSSWAVTIRRRF